MPLDPARPEFDPTDPATRADPYPLFRRLRDEEPVHWSPALRGWVLTRYDDVKAVTAAPELSAERLTPYFRALPASERAGLAGLIDQLGRWMVFRDPPVHTRLRAPVAAAFTPRAVEALRPTVERLVDELLAALPADGDCDAIADFAGPLPALAIMAMLGVPRAAMASLREWSDELAMFVGSARAAADRHERARRGAESMAEYFRSLIAERRAAPRADLVSALIAARDEGDALGEDELVATCTLLLFAGHETTTNLIGNALIALAAHPAERARLRAEPALIESAVEEFLRWDGPTHGLARVVAVAHERHGARLAEGDRVWAMLDSANRDERAFPDPDRLDLARRPNRHLTFGLGVHFCLGAPLARLEARIGLAAFLARFPRYALLAPARDLDWLDSMVLRGVRRLPIRVAGA